jgi:hypothetical protein
MHGYCTTCKWWNYTGGELLPCAKAECRLVSMDAGYYLNGPSLARAGESDGYSAWLETEPHFGCVQWVSASTASDERFIQVMAGIGAALAPLNAALVDLANGVMGGEQP